MNTREIGKQGESIACAYLERMGYTVTQRNYFTKHGEIDIIAEDFKYIVFVEVKARANTKALEKYGRPANAVNEAKRQHIRYAANRYLLEKKPQKQPRIDIIEIYMSTEKEPELKHFKNAFGGK